MKRTGQVSSAKPLVASTGTAPPPASKGRLQLLSRLGKLNAGGGTSAGLQDTEQAAAKVPAAQGHAAAIGPVHRHRVHPPPPSARAGNATMVTSNGPARTIKKGGSATASAAKNIPTPSKHRQLRAAEKYVIEREQKRVNGFDIPKHKLYTFSENTSAEFVGLRRIDAQELALLRLGDGIVVLPVDEATAQRLKRLPRGQTVTVTAKGGVKTKGRSR